MTASTIRLRRWLAGLALLLALPATSAVAQDFELPPVDEVFVLSAQATAPDRIEVRWRIADGYYLYRHRTSVKADAAFTGATMALPKGKAYRDEFFGDVETYRKELVGTLTGTPAAGASATTLTVKYQGCADAGVCYPPQTRTLKVALPGEAGAGGFGCKARGLHDYVVKNGSADHPNAEVKFALGDVVNTMIGCTNGETI
ncbi:protein-disulfide reductase DsbD domain-containing protein, partial [Escherichia coli]|uniref:protein-disulfide reductase DsbD domain-containing protein n=2 Tax=Enterobacterales TaxID=91347 RepID=UPI000B18E956